MKEGGGEGGVEGEKLSGKEEEGDKNGGEKRNILQGGA